MTDIWTYGYPLRTEVDWADDLQFNQAASRVDDDWTRMRTHHGGHRRSNPQRPTIDHGGGSVTLYGADFIPSESNVLTEAQLRGRHRFRMMLDVGDPITLFEGYLQDGRYGARRTMRFALEGLLEQAGRVKQVVAQNESPALSTDASVLALVRDAYGLSELPDVQMPATPLGLYSLDAAAARYASQFSQVAGAFPMADGSGGLRIHSPTDPPANVETFSSSEYAIVGATSEFDINQLWNYALVPFIDRGGRNNLTGSIGSTRRESGGSTYSARRGIIVPLGDRQSIDADSLSRSVRVTAFRDGDGPGPAAGYTLSSQLPSSRLAVAVGAVALQELAEPKRASLSVSVDVTGLPGTWRDFGGSQAGPNWPGAVGNIAGIQSVTIDITFNYTIVTEDVEQNLVASNEESIVANESRELDYPVWFASNAQESVQSRIDDLAEPRLWHNVDFALIQDTDQRTRNVALLNAGDYIELDVHDPRTLTDILATVMVVNVGYDIRSGEVPVKQLVCIETGERPQPAPIYLLGGSGKRRIALEGRQLSLVRR